MILAKKNGSYTLIVSGDRKIVEREVEGSRITELFGRDVKIGTITLSYERNREKIIAVIDYTD